MKETDAVSLLQFAFDRFMGTVPAENMLVTCHKDWQAKETKEHADFILHWMEKQAKRKP